MEWFLEQILWLAIRVIFIFFQAAGVSSLRTRESLCAPRVVPLPPQLISSQTRSSLFFFNLMLYKCFADAGEVLRGDVKGTWG